MSKQYTYIERRIPATPRNKRLTDAIAAAASTGGGYIGGGGGTSYWQLITTDEEGNALPEDQQYLVPVGAYPVVSLSDVVAYATSNPVANTPVTGYDTFGLVKIASGGGLVVTDGVLSIDPSAVGGIDEEALGVYLTINKYIKEDDLKEKGYLALGSPITGYVIVDEYTAITPDDTALTAIGKLERRFDGYVDLTTDQTIGGVKTFSETIYGGKDVVAYATSNPVANTPVASTTTFGLVKIGDNLTVVDGVISAVAQQSGVQFTPGTALELTANSVLNVKLGDTANTVCAGNDSRLSDARKNPYELSYVYGKNNVRENGSYDGSEAKTIYIPTNASHITFDDGYVTLSSEQTISAKKWFSGKLVVGPTNNVHLRLGEGSGNCINGYKADDSTLWNLYLNLESLSAYTLIDPSHNVRTTGDVVCYASSSAVANTPVASTSVFGLVKIGSGISVSNGVISVSTTSSGSSSWNGGTVSGDIAITKSSPTLRLTATNNSSLRWAIQNNTTSNLCFYNSKFGSDICAQVNYSTGAWTGNSDIRLKEIDGYETDILAKINGIDIIYYYWKFGITNRRMIGVGAQAVRRVLPELVSVVGWNDNIGDYSLGLDYAALGAVVAIGGLKELYKLHLNLANEVRCGAHWRTTKDEQIRQLQQECAELRVRINELEKGGAA